MPQETRLDWDFLGTVAERWGIEWARTLRDALAAGELIDMGYVNYRPELEGVERDRCDRCGGMVDRHGYCCLCKRFCGVPAYEVKGQLRLGEKTQLTLELK